MSVNPTIRLAQAVSDIDKVQLGISDLERRMDASLLGNTQEDQTALRLELSKLKALLGELRNSESFWRAELAQMLQDRKSQGEFGKG
jgi:regulator of replication initiation timing